MKLPPLILPPLQAEEEGECLGFFKQLLLKAGKERYDFPIMY